MNPGMEVRRGPALRATAGPALFQALRDRYNLQPHNAQELGGSSNLNLLIGQGGQRYVVRVYRPWVTAARLADMQAVRQTLARNGVPCVLPLRTSDDQPWIVVADRLVEVEPYVASDAKMDSWERLEAGLPWLGRIHTVLAGVHASADGRQAPAANYIAPGDLVSGVKRGVQRMRQWRATPAELELAAHSLALARLVARAERQCVRLPEQLVHGDYWDNNVLFREDRVVLIADLDFMGERARIDDLALTLYYTHSTFAEDRMSDDRLRRLRTLVDAYASGLAQPLTATERAALPLAMARTALAFIAMIAEVDSEAGARRLAAEMAPDMAWARAGVRELDRWQAAFA